MNFDILEVVRKVRALGISLEEYAILYLMYEKQWKTLDELDDNSKSIRHALLYQKMFREGYLKMSNSQSEELFALTEKAIELLEQN